MGLSKIALLDKNYFINGSFDFFQRSTALINLNATLAYRNADRWRVAIDGSSFTSSDAIRVNDAPNVSRLKNSFSFSFQRNASVASLYCSQRIESIFARDLAQKPISLTFYNKFSALPDLGLEIKIYTANVEDDFSAKTLVHTENVDLSGFALNQWHEFKLDKVLTLTDDAKRGIEVEYLWKYSSATDGAAQHLRFTGAKLAQNEKAQEFSYSARDLEEELSLCQRYFEKSYDVDANPAALGLKSSIAFIAHSASEAHGGLTFQVYKRAIPVVTTYGNNGVAGQVHRRGVGDLAVTIANGEQGTKTFPTFSGGLVTGSVYSFNYTAEAEL